MRLAIVIEFDFLFSEVAFQATSNFRASWSAKTGWLGSFCVRVIVVVSLWAVSLGAGLRCPVSVALGAVWCDFGACFEAARAYIGLV